MADFDVQRQKAFDFCADVTKQLITISAGIIAFTITFAKEFVRGVSDDAKAYAYVAWGLHFVSVLFGFLVLLALTAELEPKNSSATSPTIRGAAATYSIFQIITFLLAILLTIIFGFQAVRSPPAANQATPNPPTQEP